MRSETPAVTSDRIVRLALAFREAKALLSAAELDVFSALAERPLEGGALAKAIGIDDRGSRDFFDALTALGLLERGEDGRYRNAPDVDLYLDRRKPTYVGGELEHFNGYVYPHWNLLTPALRTGKPQSGARASGHYPALYADPIALERLAKGMTGGTLPVARSLAAKFPWQDYQTVIDVGTAQGCLPVQIARVHAHIAGGGFDLPPMKPHFDEYVRKHALCERLRFFAGDFLQDPLPAADVLVFGRVLHNWDLATKMMLLRKAYEALPMGGAVVVYERMIDDARRTNASALLASLNMVIMTAGGFDFTAADCMSCMRNTGFHDIQLASLTSEFSMITARK
jgi:hypothetical protein